MYSSKATKMVFNYPGNVIMQSVLIWDQEEKFLVGFLCVREVLWKGHAINMTHLITEM